MFFNKKTASLPILMYHEITDTDIDKSGFPNLKAPFILDKEQFRQHMELVAQSARKPIRLSELLSALECPDKIDWTKSLVITFDDGYLGNYTHAFPILKAFGYSATFFGVYNWPEAGDR